jgi:hypothetical protein
MFPVAMAPQNLDAGEFNLGSLSSSSLVLTVKVPPPRTLLYHNAGPAAVCYLPALMFPTFAPGNFIGMESLKENLIPVRNPSDERQGLP